MSAIPPLERVEPLPDDFPIPPADAGPTFTGPYPDARWTCPACGTILIDGFDPGDLRIDRQGDPVRVVLLCRCGASSLMGWSKVDGYLQ